MADRVKEKLVEIIQNSVGGCARHWAEVIADGLIANGVTVQGDKDINAPNKWISVKDRLPDLELSNVKTNDMDLLPCLCVIPHKAAKNGRYVTKLWYTGEGFVDGNNVYCDEVTHWMPLPQPPKGE